MDYKICKQLKDAGFPQDLELGAKLYDLGGGYHTWNPYSKKSSSLSKDGYYKDPTLLELIEECGDMIEGICRDKRFGGWDAYTPKRWKVGQTKNLSLKEGGKTPEIAVAKLYLNINAKK